MPTPFESAQLILTLYDQRREALMRKARDYVFTFDPQSFDDLMAALAGPDNAYIRMVLGYWEMAASLVNNGAIESKMFLDSTGEFIVIFSKIEPFLSQIREKFGNPEFASQLERLVMSIPNGKEKAEITRQRVRAVTAARSAHAAKA